MIDLVYLLPKKGGVRVETKQMKPQGNPTPIQGQSSGGRLGSKVSNKRETSIHTNSDSETEASGTDSDSSKISSDTHIPYRPPLVKQYYNRELKKWLPLSITPDIAKAAILGEKEGEDGHKFVLQ